MSEHPFLNHTVVTIIFVVAALIILYWLLYTRSVRRKQATLDEKGRPPVSPHEGIAIATHQKEGSGRSGSITS